jgi:type II secretory pathway component PulM
MIQTLVALWRALSLRERWGLAAAAGVCALALLWAWGLAPAWRTLQAMPAQRAQAQADLHLLRALAAEAQSLQQAARPATARPDQADTLRQWQTQLGLEWAGVASLRTAGDELVLELQQVPAERLAAGLAQWRTQWSLKPQRVQLQRDPLLPDAWSGRLVFRWEGGAQP